MSKRDETLTGWIRDTVDRGATSVEEIHKSIANLPLDVLERNGLFEQTAAEVRKIQDQTLGAVYDLIRDVNERVSELTSDLLPGRPSDEA
jgi:hypothetical protein